MAREIVKHQYVRHIVLEPVLEVIAVAVVVPPTCGYASFIEFGTTEKRGTRLYLRL
jgi:hypothetical protein